MVRLPELLELHDRHAPPGSLADSLGDGWLMAHDPIFRRVRETARDMGWSFSSEAAIVRRYVAFDLLCLEEILDGGVLPYVDNVTPLRHFAARAPGAAIAPTFITQSMRGNVLLHESAHAIAHRVVFGRRGPRECAAADPRGFVVHMSLAEAFANAVEDQASQGSSRRPHGFFFKVNSHFGPGLGDPEHHRAFVQRFGEARVFRGALAGYLLSNLRPEARATTPAERRAILSWMCPDASDAGGLAGDPRIAAFCDRPLSLCPSFRAAVADAHFSYLGVGSPLELLSAIDFEAAARSPEIVALAERLSGALFGDVA